MAAAPLGTLLSQTSSFTQKHLQTLLIGSVVFGLVTGALHMNLQKTAMNGMNTMMQGMETGAGSMQDVMERMQAGDEQAAEEFARQMEAMGEDGQEMMKRQAMGMMGAMLPAVGMSVLVTMLVSLLAMTYFTLVALSPEKSLGDIVSSMPAVLVPMVGLWVWTFMRSFAWIPFIGIIFALVFMPRFIAAPIYLIEQKKGVLESARLSMQATRFYWGKIMGNIIALGLLVIVASVVLGIVTAMIPGTMVGGLAMSVAQQFFVAVFTVFSVQLARTIMQNPVQVA